MARPAIRSATPRRFVILTAGRAGSILLVSLLRSHPRLVVRGELFGRGHGEEFRGHARIRDTDVLLDRATKAAARSGAAAWGFSLHVQHFVHQGIADPEAWCRRFGDRGGRIVTLVRENVVESSLSALVSIAHDKWHERQGDEGTSLPAPVHIDPIEALAGIVELEDATQQVQRLAAERTHLELIYERDLKTPDAQARTVARVFEFLGVEPAPVQTDLVRRAAPFRELIENYDEVAAAIKTASPTYPMPP